MIKNKLLEGVASDPGLMEERVSLWSQNFLLWFFDCFYTKDEGLGQERVAPRFLYLKSLHGAVEAERIIWIEKSRQLFITWYMVARFLWKLMYGQDMRLIYGSRVEGDVKDVISTRFEEAYNRLDRSFPIPKLIFRSLTIENPDSGMLMQGMSSSGQGSRGKTGAELWLDEIAFQENQESLIRSSIESINAPRSKLIGVTTPNPQPIATATRNLIADSIDMNIKRLELSKGVKKSFNTKGHCVLSVSHFAHPDRQEVWRDAKIKEIGEVAYSIEHGLNWEVARGKPCFWGFDLQKHIKSLQFDNDLPLHIGIDPGTGHPAVVFFQRTRERRCNVLWSFTSEQTDMSKLCELIEGVIVEKFDSHDDFRFYIDPAGGTLNPHGTEVAAEAIFRYFQKPITAAPRTKPEERIRIINDFFGTGMISVDHDSGEYYFADGRVKTGAFIYMLTTGYALDQRGIPIKGGTEAGGQWDHIADAWGYGFICVFSPARDIDIRTQVNFSVRPAYQGGKVKNVKQIKHRFL